MNIKYNNLLIANVFFSALVLSLSINKYNLLIMVAAFFYLLVNILIYLVNKTKEKYFGGQIIDYLNFNRELINYNTILEQIITLSKISVNIKDSHQNQIISSSIFDKIPSDTELAECKLFALEGNNYKVTAGKIKDFLNHGESTITLLQDVTDEFEEQKNKEAAFAMIAHDLKNPIYASERALYLLYHEKFGELNNAQKDILKMSYSSVNFAKQLVNNILAAYKSSTQNVSLLISEFDLVDLINECKSEAGFLADEKQLKFIINMPSTLFISGDRLEIQRVVLNLLFNAINYSEQNSDIELTLSFDEAYVNFTVQNVGDYISPVELENIFEKNITLSKKYNKPGTGLGLYLSKKIIDAHDGIMIAKSFHNNINIFGFKLKVLKLADIKAL